MAVTITTIARQQLYRGKNQAWVNIALDNSYPTGGYVISPSNLKVKAIQAGGVLASSDGRSGFWDQTNKKLKMFNSAATEAPNATNLAATMVTMLFLYD